VKITVTFTVDEERCKEMAGVEDINAAISIELGWVAQRGIWVESIQIQQPSEEPEQVNIQAGQHHASFRNNQITS